ncbi:MAG: NAD(P)H-dependent oxidoreductase subunit E [Nitrospiraceae bacterium]|nr:MAG: NAD(P)H-dependent oxidoreductase subunit E [Nitrospiraceae bacterium]
MDDKLKRLIIKLTHRFPEKEAAILPALAMIQKRNGHVSGNDMEEMARIMKIPEARVFSAASFYSMLSLKPVGKYHVQVCSNVVCSLLNGFSILDHLAGKIGIREGEVTRDGLFSISSVECLGSCGYAPAMLVNTEHYENMSIEKVDRVIDSIMKKEGRT